MKKSTNRHNGTEKSSGYDTARTQLGSAAQYIGIHIKSSFPSVRVNLHSATSGAYISSKKCLRELSDISEQIRHSCRRRPQRLRRRPRVCLILCLPLLCHRLVGCCSRRCRRSTVHKDLDGEGLLLERQFVENFVRRFSRYNRLGRPIYSSPTWWIPCLLYCFFRNV